jgi:hypothetical protein
MLFDRTARRGFIVNGQRDDLDTRFRELFPCTLEARKLSLTVGTPCAAVD